VKIFVPIKENSQRVFRKNFRKLNGVPLYIRLFEKLKDFEVYVDTDSDKIIDELTARYNNVTAYKRKKSLEGDEISVCDLINNFITKFKLKKEWVCQVHVTSPFLKMETLNAVEILTKSPNFDSVVSCNILQTRLWKKENYGFIPVNHNPVVLQQTQDLAKYYEENSLFYAFRADLFKKTNMRIGSTPYFYETDFPENLDIDTEEDWSLVEKIAESN
jgi:CMP-N-acetylneuraminic acid synthetase